ncbi:GD18067 [Drosophila simulans]|uniref:GD18067 n=1 Tax=Drosophila simulans TaxID=7240 RepID=B4QY25_DROSI|nr:GD18067 [Drosophila simulans]
MADVLEKSSLLDAVPPLGDPHPPLPHQQLQQEAAAAANAAPPAPPQQQQPPPHQQQQPQQQQLQQKPANARANQDQKALGLMTCNCGKPPTTHTAAECSF